MYDSQETVKQEHPATLCGILVSSVPEDGEIIKGFSHILFIPHLTY
jgi:hypothetical protein